MQAHEPPPPVRMVELLGGFRISQALYAAAALGVPDQLVAGPAPVKALAERVGAHAPSLHRLLRTLASTGVFTEPQPGVFALTPLGQTLTSSQPGSMRDLAIMWMETHYAPFAELIQTIRTGRPAAEHLYGEPFFAWLSHHPEQTSRFTGAMANLTSGGFKSAAIASLPLDGTRTIVDIGGADGTVLATILAGHPHMRGVLFDLPHVITDAPRTLASHGVDDRVDCVGGDFFESVPAGADAYLVSVVLHNWPDQLALRILANIAAAGGSGARLLMIEFVVPPDGKERTETEWRELLTAADFTSSKSTIGGTSAWAVIKKCSARPWRPGCLR